MGGQGIGVNPLEGGNRVKDQNVERTGCLAAVIWLNQTEQMAIPGVAAETKEQHPNVGVSHLTNPLNGRPLLKARNRLCFHKTCCDRLSSSQ